MKLIRLLLCSSALLLVFSQLGVAQPPAVPRQVTAVRGTPEVFDQRDGQFVQRPMLPEGINWIGSQVVEESARGYVQLEVEGLGRVWVQRMRVEYPRQPLRARCVAGISAVSDASLAGARGAGAGCSK